MSYGFYEATRDRDWLRDEHGRLARENERLMTENAALRKALRIENERAEGWKAEAHGVASPNKQEDADGR